MKMKSGMGLVEEAIALSRVKVRAGTELVAINPVLLEGMRVWFEKWKVPQTGVWERVFERTSVRRYARMHVFLCDFMAEMKIVGNVYVPLLEEERDES